MWEKLKSFAADDAIFNSLLLILVAVASFGLGRKSMLESETEKSLINSADVEIQDSELSVPPPVPILNTASTSEPSEKGFAGEVVASKSGSKYHLPTCPGAAQIKPENLVSFASVAAAEAAGYTPAANCPGL